MGAIFAEAVEVVLAHEGGYTVDHAGPTNYGVTLRTLRDAGLDVDQDGDIDADDIRRMNRRDAMDVYRRLWWDRYSYGLIEDQNVATKIFDLSVNMGPRTAHRVAQRACRAAGERIVVDGILGPISFRTLNTLHPLHLLVAMRSEAAGVYRMIVQNIPEHAKYLKGWLNRAYD